MQVTKEQINPCKLALTISVEPETVKVARNKAYAQAAQTIQLPGFRKGKVPPQMARAYVDETRVRQRAAEMLVGPAYAEALQQEDVEPFGGLQPEVELVEFPEDGALVFKAFVPLRPVVTLGPYKGLEVEKRRLEVTDADVERQVEEIRARHAEYPEVTDRTVQMGDVLLVDLSAVIEGLDDSELSQTRSTVVEVGKSIPDFDNGLVGMAVGETKTIEALYPEAYADEKLRGKRATFTVALKELRARILPELTEEFIQRVRPTAHNEEELRTEIRESLLKAATQMSDNDLEFSLVGKIVDTSQVFFPDGLLRAEMQADITELQDRLKRENATVEQYLAATGKTVEEVEQEFGASADRRIRNSLVLAEIARTEGIGVEDEDVDAQIAERAEQAKVSTAAVRAFLEKNDQMNQVRDQALTEKILAYLKESATITERVLTSDEMDAEMQASETAQTEAVAATINEPVEAAEPAAPLALEDAKPKRRTKKADAESAVTETPGAEIALEGGEAPATETVAAPADGETPASEVAVERGAGDA